MEIVVTETIRVSTSQGDCEIQLCLGDITKLPKKNKVDILMVSAFPGDYTPVPGTMIGALKQNMGIDVRDLARNKREDLREHFHCWISHNLSESAPYKQILCFEQSRQNMTTLRDNKVSLVASIFRALFTYASQTEAFSVITPLLGTGNQNLNKKAVLRSMLSSCITWMRAGMPLQRLMLVIFMRHADAHLSIDDEEAMQEFHRIKLLTEKENLLRVLPSIELDSYVIYAEADESIIQRFVQHLLDKQSNLRIECKGLAKEATSGEEQAIAGDGASGADASSKEDEETKLRKLMKKESVVNDDLRSIMLKSRHVLVALSVHLLQCPRGLEYYNMAWCLTRTAQRQLLLPLYVNTIENLPTYMALIQWVDLRLKERDKPGTDKVKEGADNVLALLQKPVEPAPKTTDKGKNKTQKSTALQSEPGYDLFISYCHRDSAVALELLQTVQAAHPQLQIFFDKNEIKTGFSWQVTVYEALCRSKVVVALLSSAYFQSSVCSEELALALSRQRCNAGSTYLIPVAVQEAPLVEVAPSLLASEVPILVAPDGMDKKLFVKKLANALTSFKHEDLRQDPIFRPSFLLMPTSTLSLETVLSKCRAQLHQSLWQIESNGLITWKITTKTPVAPPPGDAEKPVLGIIHHDDEVKVAEVLKRMLDRGWKGSVTVRQLNLTSDTEISSLDTLSTAVVLLAPAFVTSPSCANALQVCLSLQRSRGAAFYLCPVILSPLPDTPLYLHLIPCRFHVLDPLVVTMAERCVVASGDVKYIVESSNIHYLHKMKRSGLPMTVRVLLYCTAEWILHCTDCGRLSAEEGGALPVLLSVEDFKKTGFIRPQLCAVQPSLFRDVKFTEESVKNAENQKVSSSRPTSTATKTRSNTENLPPLPKSSTCRLL